jgi:hypothetical protein
MSARIRVLGWLILAIIVSPGATVAAQPVCAAAERLAPTRELHYVMNARVRPLLIWISRSHVGAGRITWSDTRQTRRVELLVGSDPLLTPLHVNRWGYIAETVCAAGADLLGVMTESEEATASEASASVARGEVKGQAFRSIRSRISAGRSEADVARLSLHRPLTYHQIDSLLPLLVHATGEKREIVLADDTQPGFLMAVAALAAHGVSTTRGIAPGPLAVVYVYNGQLFDLQLASIEEKDGQVETEFRTRNRLTGSTSRFSISFDSASGEVTPTRIRFRPRWWLEAELVLDRNATRSTSAARAGKEER